MSTIKYPSDLEEMTTSPMTSPPPLVDNQSHEESTTPIVDMVTITGENFIVVLKMQRT